MQPPDILITSHFLYKLCKIKHLNFLDDSKCNILITFTVIWSSLTPHTFLGNYGKTADVVVKSKKSGSREDLTEDRQALLESDDELEREEPVPGPQDKSVTAPRRPQPTEYDG